MSGLACIYMAVCSVGVLFCLRVYVFDFFCVCVCLPVLGLKFVYFLHVHACVFVVYATLYLCCICKSVP